MNSCLRALYLDVIERLVILAFYGYMIVAIFCQEMTISTFLLLASEGTVFLFVAVRPFSKDISIKFTDWVFAVFGTVVPTLARPGSEHWAPTAVCGALMLAGFLLQIAAKLSLRRRFGIVPANRGIQANGPYRLIRHPIYAGYQLTLIGFFLNYPTLRNSAVYCIATAFQIGRILAEEKYLSEDEEYRDFLAHVRYRLIPCVF